MTREDWFGLGVRLVGLWHLSMAARHLISALAMRLNVDTFAASPFSDEIGDDLYLYYFAANGVIGICFLCGANLLTQLVYPRASQPSPDSPDSPDSAESPESPESPESLKKTGVTGPAGAPTEQ